MIDHRLSRRSMLRGLGVSMALPCRYGETCLPTWAYQAKLQHVWQSSSLDAVIIATNGGRKARVPRWNWAKFCSP